ncbi:MAG: SDR family oxidoreductase [Balneola sp.]|nr:SDR family oxidoreductase [Balneola sp.]MBO6650048.1 SDR family oxidoreductase [Balneola sp.]MBO6711602.1 SDR family oxidoreductase [Balneola sp.]MBO6799798.1 SDR family oxidoreductase [Balneola sp.]MBO6870761.1 SDR family oxidoreductase [Balneola sp.]
MKSADLDSVLIIGCGWVGTKLATTLISQNINVFGSTRSAEKASSLRSLGIEPIIFDLEKEDTIQTDLPKVDAIVISVSPGRGDQRSQYPNHIQKLSTLLASSNQQVIIYSSTSAYKGKMGIVTELDALPDPETDNVILAAEGELKTIIPDSVILRLGGLFGSDRHPVKYLAGREGISNGDAPVNLVHREDVIAATISVLSQKIPGVIFNVCSDHHPTKKELYTNLSEKLGLETPSFNSGGSDEKLVDGSRIKKELGFEYKQNDLFLYTPDESFFS